MSHRYEISIAGPGITADIKEASDEIPDVENFDDIDAELFDSFIGVDCDRGVLIVRNLENGEETKHDLSELHQLYSREAYIQASAQEYFEDEVDVLLGEGNSALGAGQLTLDAEIDLRRFSAGIVETVSGEYVESLFYDLTAIDLGGEDSNFGSQSIQVMRGYVGKDDWENSAGYRVGGSELEEVIESLRMDMPNWPDE